MFKKIALLWIAWKQARRHAPLARRVSHQVRVIVSRVVKNLRKK